MIKINPAAPAQTANKGRPVRRSDNAFALGQSSTANSDQAGPVNSVATLSALIELQGRSEPEKHDDLVWSSKTLDLLEDLHRAVVTDVLTDEALQALRSTLTRQNMNKGAHGKGPLQELQAQIMLRVRVELAKRALD